MTDNFHKATKIAPRPSPSGFLHPSVLQLGQIAQGSTDRTESHDVRELRCVHASLFLRVSKLESELTACTAELSQFRMLHVRHTNSADKLLCPCIRPFAMRNAVKALCDPNTELTRVHTSITEKNSVHQFFVRSKAPECALLEFRVLDKAIQSRMFPSTFHVLCTGSVIAAHFEIYFLRYRDICNALRIDPFRNNLEFTGKKSKSQDVRAFQALGFDHLSTGSSADFRGKRIILLGCNSLTASFCSSDAQFCRKILGIRCRISAIELFYSASTGCRAVTC